MTYNERNDAAYLSRMRLIQRWRRIANLICLLLALYIGFLFWIDRPATAYSTRLMIQSLAAFAVATLVAVNLLTFLLRKPSANKGAVGAISSGVEKDG